MPLRYSKVLRSIFKEILHMQQIGQLDADTDDKLAAHLHTHRKAFRELQRRADRRQQCPVLVLSPGLTCALYDPKNAHLFTKEAVYEAFKHVRVPDGDFEPLTDAQYAVMQANEPAERGEVRSTLLDELHNDDRE